MYNDGVRCDRTLAGLGRTDSARFYFRLFYKYKDVLKDRACLFQLSKSGAEIWLRSCLIKLYFSRACFLKEVSSVCSQQQINLVL